MGKKNTRPPNLRDIIKCCNNCEGMHFMSGRCGDPDETTCELYDYWLGYETVAMVCDSWTPDSPETQKLLEAEEKNAET